MCRAELFIVMFVKEIGDVSAEEQKTVIKKVFAACAHNKVHERSREGNQLVDQVLGAQHRAIVEEGESAEIAQLQRPGDDIAPQSRA